MFNFYEATERRKKEKAAEAKRLKDLEDETDAAAWRLYQALNDFVTNKGLSAVVHQHYRDVTVKKADDSLFRVSVSEGPTFEFSWTGQSQTQRIIDDATRKNRTKLTRDLENALVDWLGVA